jgi:hypothetical protein
MYCLFTVEIRPMTEPQPRCVACDADSNQVPLLQFEYQGATHRICPQHLPILIHDPTQLAGRLPGAESMSPAEHKD